jgi:DNA repair protein RadC
MPRVFAVADYILTTGSIALVSDSVEEVMPGPRPASRRNPDPGLAESAVIPESALPPEFFGGHVGLLVRTALVRLPNYDEARKSAPIVSSSRDVVRACSHLADADNEYVVVLALDVRNKVIAIYEAAIGGVSTAGADPQQILKVPLLCGAAGAILVHNHPSGSSAPSPEDLAFTKRVRAAFECVGLQLLDHVIIGNDEKFSFLDAGLLNERCPDSSTSITPSSQRPLTHAAR